MLNKTGFKLTYYVYEGVLVMLNSFMYSASHTGTSLQIEMKTVDQANVVNHNPVCSLGTYFRDKMG